MVGNHNQELLEGRVVAHLGKALAIESNGKTILCHTLRQLEVATVGDRVLWESTSSDQGRVVDILPRDSLLSRPGRNGKSKPVAANLDQIVIMFAVIPECDFLLIDQYLVICENHNINAVLTLNKIDLLDESSQTDIKTKLKVYEKLGYSIQLISAKDKTNLEQFKVLLKGQMSMLAGQSGVGKSSLTRQLIPNLDLKTNTLSASNKHGRHTTTTATLYHLPTGGSLIDSPGVAIFGLANITEQQLAYGYREFQPYIEQCQFNDCRHLNDKGCAVLEALEQGAIAPHRYQRFLKLRQKLPLLSDSH